VESGSNAVVDFGKFCTGFLVLMGIGTLHPIDVATLSCEEMCVQIGDADWMDCSTAGGFRTLGNYPRAGDDHVDCWRPADLWDHHQLWDVLPGRAGVLGYCRS
jgi:hypothetical protein